MVRLRDSLANPGTPLLRLAMALTEDDTPSEQDTKTALIAQTGAADPSSVKTEVKENRKLSPGEVDNAIALYRAGASIRSIARDLRLHEQTVRAHLKRRQISIRPIRALTEAQEVEAVRLYVDEMWSLDELARRFTVGAGAVRSALIRKGIERRGQVKRARKPDLI